VRRLIGAAIAVLALACASAGTPPGGPEDHTPPQIVSISPDSGETNVKLKHVEFKFDEVVSDRPVGAAQLDQIFLISPRNGQPDVSWHRTRIDVRPKNGFRANTTYRVTMLPGIVDLRSNVRKVTTSIVFSTGGGFPPLSILGRVFDWAAQRPANGAYIEATLRTDTTVVYLGASDSLGEFDVGPLPPGTYTVRALMDQNNNRMLDRNEKWDTVTVAVRDVRPHFEMLAIERDTTPAALESITAVDSVSLRVTFDKPLDPRIPLQPALVRLQHADSSAIDVARVQWLSEWDRQKAARDSARKADSLKAAQPPGAAPTPTAPPAAQPLPGQRPTAPRGAPTPPKPSVPPPDRGIVVTIAPPAQFVPLETYRITVNGLRNLVGKSREQTRTFTVPKPPPPLPPKPPADTAKKTPPPGRPPNQPPSRPPHSHE
jgi:Bacterial Ig-like domain